MKDSKKKDKKHRKADSDKKAAQAQEEAHRLQGREERRGLQGLREGEDGLEDRVLHLLQEALPAREAQMRQGPPPRRRPQAAGIEAL